MKMRAEWKNVFSNIGWDYLSNVAIEQRWFNGQDPRGDYASFWYGDFEELSHRMSIFNGMQ